MFAAIFAMAIMPSSADAQKGRKHKHQLPRATTGEVAPAPTTGVGGAAIADNFVYENGIQTHGTSHVEDESVVDGGAFRFFCRPGQVLNDDPIVNPGATASHGHQFWGNTLANRNSTYQTLRTTGGSTCVGTDAQAQANPVNRASYWMPAMLDGQGSVHVPYAINIYYKSHRPSHVNFATNTGNVEADLHNKVGYYSRLPAGLRFVNGYLMSTMTPRNIYDFFFDCRYPSDWAGPENPGDSFDIDRSWTNVPTCAVGMDFVIMMDGHDCWNGTELDSADHSSHLVRVSRDSNGAEPGGFEACPFTHPYKISSLRFQAHYRVDSTYPTWQLTSDRLHGTARGETIHFDYWEAWSPTAREEWHSNCIEKNLSCSNSDFGNGRGIRGIVDETGSLPPQVIKRSADGVN